MSWNAVSIDFIALTGAAPVTLVPAPAGTAKRLVVGLAGVPTVDAYITLNRNKGGVLTPVVGPVRILPGGVFPPIECLLDATDETLEAVLDAAGTPLVQPIVLENT